MVNEPTQQKIAAIWDIFWSNGLANPLSVIEQISYLMFIKILDDNETRNEATSNALGFELENRIFDDEHQNCRWSIFKDYDPETMYENMKDKVFPFIKHGLAAGKDTAYAKYMKNALFQVPSPRVLVRVVDAIDELNLNNKDSMGDVYEELLSKIEQNGKLGQFRTPRHIINMIVELVKPSAEDYICDPAMGSAGFLCAAARYVKEHDKDKLFNEKIANHVNSTMLTGFDTDETMLRIGAMNLMLHQIDSPTINWQDSVSSDNELRNKFTLILANPPFSGSIDKETISKDLLTIANTSKTELLFLAVFLRMLKVGGRCASVVPDGVLFGSSNAHKAIRKEIVDNNRLEAVISMPSGVFLPYAGVKTSILIFTKTLHGGTDNVWFYDMKNDGKSLDIKRSDIEGSNIPDIIERFNNLDGEKERTRKDQSFFVPLKEIQDNDYDLTFNKYKEIEKEEKVYRSTEEIINDIVNLNKELNNNLSNIQEIIKNS